MVRETTLKASLDDAMLALRMTDFSGGLFSECDVIDLPDNASSDCENVICNLPGKLKGRAGSDDKVTGLASKPDGIAYFYDSGGTRRCLYWHSGNTYSWNFTSSSLTLVQSSSYAAGKKIAWAALNGILYYSDGETFTGSTPGTDRSGIRQYNAVAGTDTPLISSYGSGEIDTPAAYVLNVYAGSLILGSIKYEDGTLARHSFTWSSVNDPTSINGASVQKVGEGHGGIINCIQPLSVASTGVSPFRSLIVGKSEFGIYGYKGALGSLEEYLVNCPAGVKDGETMRYIPGPEGSGLLAFLGTDNKIWGVNGIAAIELSAPIRSELQDYITDQLIADPDQRFSSAVYNRDFQYIVDCGGGRQYVYHYNNGSWSRYRGWSSGHYVAAKDSRGIDTLYVADRTNKTLTQCATGTDDNGTAISPYWTSKAVHGQDHNIFKIWKKIIVNFATNTGDITVQATTNLGEGKVSSKTITVPANELATDLTGVYGVSTYGSAVYAATIVLSTKKYKKETRLDYVPAGLDSRVNLRGYDVTIKISTSVSGAHFELLGYTLLYLPRGRKRIA